MKQTKIMIGDGIWHMPMSAFKNANNNAIVFDDDTVRYIKAQATVIAALTNYMLGAHND